MSSGDLTENVRAYPEEARTGSRSAQFELALCYDHEKAIKRCKELGC